MSIDDKLNNLNDVKKQKVGEDVVGFKLALKDVVPHEFEKGWSIDLSRHGKCHIVLWREEKEWIVNLFKDKNVLKKCGLDGGMEGFNSKIVEIVKRAVRKCDADGVSSLGCQQGQIRLGTTYREGCDSETPLAFIALRIPVDLFKYIKALATTLDTNNAGLVIQIVRDFLSYHGIEGGAVWGESSLRSRPIRGGGARPIGVGQEQE